MKEIRDQIRQRVHSEIAVKSFYHIWIFFISSILQGIICAPFFFLYNSSKHVHNSSSSFVFNYVSNCKTKRNCDTQELVSLIAPWPKCDQNVKRLWPNRNSYFHIAVKTHENESLRSPYVLFCNEVQWFKYRLHWLEFIMWRIKHITFWLPFGTVAICDVTERWLSLSVL